MNKTLSHSTTHSYKNWDAQTSIDALKNQLQYRHPELNVLMRR
jgi:hypothetical protein